MRYVLAGLASPALGYFALQLFPARLGGLTFVLFEIVVGVPLAAGVGLIIGGIFTARSSG